MQDLPSPVFEKIVKEYPPFDEIVDCAARLARAEEILTGLYLAIARLMAGDYPQYLRRASLAKAVDAGLAAVAMNRDFSRTILGPRHLLTSSDFTVTIHRQRGGDRTSGV